MKEFIGANCKDKKERETWYNCHLKEGEHGIPMAQLANEHQRN